MIESIVNYMGTLPMLVQLLIICAVVSIPFGVGVVMIYKLFKAEKIKAGPVEIDMEDNDKNDK